MKKIFISYYTILLLIATLSIFFTYICNSQKNIHYLTNVSNYIVKEHSPKKTISNPTIQIKENTIKIRFDLNNRFEKMDAFYQFAVFEFFTKHLRYLLFSDFKKSKFETYDYVLSAHTEQNSYVHRSKLSNKQLIYSNESSLSKNQKVIYTSNEFKKQHKKIATLFKREKINGYDDYEIFIYGRNFFNTMTKNGRYYNPKIDNQLVINAVTKKFGITVDDYAQLQKKYYILY